MTAAALIATPLTAAPQARPGGDTTVEITGRNAFSMPAANLDDAGRERFAIGNSFFRRNWVEAPASTQARDGLGPHFIARSCGGCHVNDGRGAPPQAGSSQAAALLLRLSVPGAGSHGEPLPEPTYGHQLSTSATTGVRPEGQLVVHERQMPVQLKDGSRVLLRQPVFSVSALGYGPMAADTMKSPRLAPQLIGVGLIEAITEADIEANALTQAQRRDGIRGVVNRVWDAPSQQTRVGRFGWKANVASLAHQTAAAFVGDMGVTSPLFTEQDCTPRQPDCLRAPQGGQPEIDQARFADVVFYQAALAPPARRVAREADLQEGERLFERAGCAACHRPSYVTGPSAERHLAGQQIWPYTDLLLHDMGEGLADGRPDFLANGRQWKTPPLWGIGLLQAVNGHQRLLHDGRARGVAEAILWHGGEGRASRDSFAALSQAQRSALLRFVESL
ncbi:MAG TPA: di-heme oxidoredictase family protein [Burkholderiaceae bacterium]|nr:di-heme oxidoredictase family protein [Burkholderiaceae bacterium]